MLKDYRESFYFRGLCFSHKGTRVIYRYPLQYDNDEFLQKLFRFIVNDLKNGDYLNIKSNCNTYHVSLIDGQIQFVDKNSFNENERKYKKDLNLSSKEI